MKDFFELTPERWLNQVEAALELGPLTGRLWPLNSLENRVYEVELENHPEHYVIKFHRPGSRHLNELLEEQDFIDALVAAEVPVLTTLRNPKLLGNSFLELAPGFYASLSRRIRGRLNDELSGEQWMSLGRALAQFHSVAAGWSFRHRPHFFMPLENWQENLSPWAVGSSGQRYLQMLDSKLKLLLETAMSFPAQIIHGDLHVGNLLWIQDELTLLDFDECSFGPIAQDFWLLAPGRESWAQKARQSLIQGYLELRECQEYQDSDFEVLRALRLVRYNLWIASRFEDPAFQAQFPHFGKDRWWEEESEAWLRATE